MEEVKKEQQAQTEDMATLLSTEEVSSPELQIGEKVKGKVLQITDESIFLAVGGKMDAVMQTEEMRDDEGNLKVKEGDEIEAFVAKLSEEEILLSLSFGSDLNDRRLLKNAHENKIPVEGKVTEKIKGGFVVRVMNKRAFCPISQIDMVAAKDANDYLRNKYHFLITEYNNQNMVVSRRALLDKQRAEKAEEMFNSINEGDLVEGKVVRMTTYGAFLDLGGLEGLMHISEFAWEKIENPQDVLEYGQSYEVRVIRKEGNPNKPRISLSLRLAQDDPFDKFAENHSTGETITGTVVRLVPFGAFVEVEPGVEGLVHISEVTRGRRIAHPSEELQKGESVSAEILEIDPEKRKLSLSIKSLQKDLWADIEGLFEPGQEVKGTVERIDRRFGAFVRLNDQIVGLLPISKIKVFSSLKNIKEGQEVELQIERIDSEKRKISLTSNNEVVEETAQEEVVEQRPARSERPRAPRPPRKQQQSSTQQSSDQATYNPFADFFNEIGQ